MKKITVYADFDFLSATQEIGTLGYEHIRGKDHFVFPLNQCIISLCHLRIHAVTLSPMRCLNARLKVL